MLDFNLLLYCTTRNKASLNANIFEHFNIFNPSFNDIFLTSTIKEIFVTVGKCIKNINGRKS